MDPRDPELEEEIRGVIAVGILGGYESRTAILERIATDYGDDAARIAAPWVDEALDRQTRIETTWGEPTDVDRLEEAFAEIETDGVLTAPCRGRRAADLRAEMGSHDARQPGSVARGYVGFSSIDLESALAHGGLSLCLGAFEDDDADLRAVRKLVVDALERHGFEVESLGDDRLFLPGFVWKKRRRRVDGGRALAPRSRVRTRRWKAVAAMLAASVLVAGVAAALFLRDRPRRPSPTDVHRGSMLARRAIVVFRLVLVAEPGSDALEVVRGAIAADRTFEQATDLPQVPTKPVVIVLPQEDGHYDPSVLSSLEYFSRGIPESERPAIASSTHFVDLLFAYPPREASRHLAAAQGIVANVARRTGAYVEDADSREWFSVEAFDALRTHPAPGRPSATRAITFHAYRDGEAFRVVTLGMERFGLPDLAARCRHEASLELVHALLTAIVDRAVEAPRVDRDGALEVELREGDSARARVRVVLAPATRSEGDPENRLWAPVRVGDESLEAYLEAPERLREVTRSTYGVPDGSEEMKSAIAAARSRLPELEAPFHEGSRMRSLRVKASLGARAPHEYLWLHVERWDGDTLRGTLQTTPLAVDSDLAAGDVVDVPLADVVDYTVEWSDGRTEGGATDDIAERIGVRADPVR